MQHCIYIERLSHSNVEAKTPIRAFINIKHA